MKPLIIDFHPMPFFFLMVALTRPMKAKKEIVVPERKGIKPVPGEAGDPILYWRDPRLTARPKRNHTALLH